MFGSISIYTSPLLHFHLSPTPISIHEILVFEMDLWVYDFKLTKAGNDPTHLFIYSLYSSNFTSASNTRDLILHNFSYYIFGLATGSLFHPCHPQ